MAKDTRWGAGTVQIGKDLFGVAKRLQGRLERRGITTAFLEECQVLVAGTEAAASGQPVRLGSQKGATLALGDLLGEAATVTAAVREAIVKKHPKRKDVHKVFGVGGADAGGSVKNALAAIDAVLKGATDFPAEAAAAKIIEDDLAELRALRVSILESDKQQESVKDGKKGGTVVRDDLVLQLTSRIDDVLNAAGLEFKKEPETLKQFTDVIPSKKKAKVQPTT